MYVYPTHGYLLTEFMSRTLNDRSDDYGGSLENRLRLARELLEETRDAVGDRCAVAVRFSADGLGDEHFSADESRDAMEQLGPLADVWDIVVGDYYGEEMATSRFVQEASLEAKVADAKRLTGRPVVSVGRFTSPDTMVRQLRSGRLDFVGAARPSIADPFLPTKIREGRLEDIRECIGCNICYAHNYRGAALRCTQNPTMGEEWRGGWHPESVPAGPGGTVLVVGAGPAGLEAALTLGRRAVYTPDDLMRGTMPDGTVVVYDDDNYYMGAVLALQLARAGRAVTYVTSEGRVAAWSVYTGEQEATQSQLLASGVRVVVNSLVAAFDGARLDLACAYSGASGS